MATVLANAGRALLTSLLKLGGLEPKYMGWGTGAGTAAVADTTLFTETALNLSTTSGTRITGTSTQVTTSVTNDTYNLAGTFTASAAGTVTNIGCFDNATIGSGNLLVKGDFTGVVMANGDSLAATIKLQFS
jgi:hypothetical protein